MDLLRALYNSYNYALKHKKVDQHDGKTVILPLFHNNMRSNGENIVEIELNSKGKFFDAHFIEKNQYIVFPVTYYSSTRSGKMPPPHPLVDKTIYILPSTLEHHKLYREEFINWKECVENEKVSEFLDKIDKYILSDNWFEELLDHLFKEYQRNDLIVSFKSEGKDKEIDFKDVFLTFKINNFIDGEDKTVTDYVELHNSYIRYIESNLVEDGICNISGEEDFISRRHRGLMGSARIVAVSNNTETYRGRFRTGDDIFNLGFITSEKAHLMLRYLMENPNSNQFLADTQYLVNWFSDDITNESKFDPTDPNEDLEETEYKNIVAKQNKDIGSSFIKGVRQFSLDAKYYILLLDKSSAGRISIKYFRELPVSELLERLKKWNELYNWPAYIEESGELVDRVPNFYNLFVSAYGVERDKKLVAENKNFTKDQMQKMITAMIEGELLSANIKENLKNNIRFRKNYKNTWAQIKRTALSVLRNEREKRYDNMLDRDNLNRSYLYGRLLAVYELIENANYNKDKESSDDRITNAEKFWTAYINNPARTQVTLERNVQVYLNKLMRPSNSGNEDDKDKNKIGLAIKYKKAKSEIIEALSQLYKEDPKEMTKPLEFDFIFGYEAQKQELYKSKKDK